MVTRRLYQSVCYCMNLRRSASVLTDYYDRTLEPAGMMVTQFCLLVNLQRLGSANLTQWAEKVGLERSTMVRNVRGLEKRGWIIPAAGRGRRFMLSPQGEAALAQAMPLWQQTQARVEQYLSEADAQALLRITARLQQIPDMPENA